jgi:hypothetical protein
VRRFAMSEQVYFRFMRQIGVVPTQRPLAAMCFSEQPPRVDLKKHLLRPWPKRKMRSPFTRWDEVNWMRMRTSIGVEEMIKGVEQRSLYR